MFSDKTLLITGGTGSFGNAVLDRFLNTDIGEIESEDTETVTETHDTETTETTMEATEKTQA